MLADRQGNQMTGATCETVELFDRAVTAFNLYRGTPVELLDQAVDQAPDFAMAHILRVHLLALSTEAEATERAARRLAQVQQMDLNEREASHVAALRNLVDGNWTAASEALNRHNGRYPYDLVALQSGHLMDFYRANAASLHDRIAQVMPQWSRGMPGYSVVLGMLAFGLEESGDLSRAEAVGREAIEVEPLNCWAHHAVAHVMEMQGRAEEGISWMQAREPYWAGDGNFFQIHNWWHKALFHLELGEADAALTLYDGRIRGEKSAVAVQLVDASALLWRLSAAGFDVGERWTELSENWDRHTMWTFYPFNDWHAVMAHLGAGQDAKVERMLECYRRCHVNGAETSAWACHIGRPLIEGFTAFWRGDYQAAASWLTGARNITQAFGGSHAQRDVITWTLTEAALRGGLTGLAESLASERLTMKPHSPLTRSFLTRAVPSPERMGNGAWQR